MIELSLLVVAVIFYWKYYVDIKSLDIKKKKVFRMISFLVVVILTSFSMRIVEAPEGFYSIRSGYPFNWIIEWYGYYRPQNAIFKFSSISDFNIDISILFINWFIVYISLCFVSLMLKRIKAFLKEEK